VKVPLKPPSFCHPIFFTPFVFVIAISVGCEDRPSIAQDNLEGWNLRAEKALEEGKPDRAIRELDEVIKQKPNNGQLHVIRGSVYFRSNRITESIADFDKCVELEPQSKPFLWQRGIALYYAGKFQEGLDQFAIHREVNPNDVENAFWHFLCNVRLNGVEASQKDVLLAGFDNRPPLMQVQQLIQGKIPIEEVIAATEKNMESNSQRDKLTRFYGYLYIGLYYDAIKQPDQAKKYLQLSVDQGLSNYMADVAKVHLLSLKK
jgi:lipoprotein NlpI